MTFILKSHQQGWGAKFSNDASKAFPIVPIGGGIRMEVQMNFALRRFQEADNSGDSDSRLVFKADWRRRRPTKRAISSATIAASIFVRARPIWRTLLRTDSVLQYRQRLLRPRISAPPRNLKSMAPARRHAVCPATSLSRWLPKPLICRRPTILPRRLNRRRRRRECESVLRRHYAGPGDGARFAGIVRIWVASH